MDRITSTPAIIEREERSISASEENNARKREENASAKNAKEEIKFARVIKGTTGRAEKRKKRFSHVHNQGSGRSSLSEGGRASCNH